MRVHNVANVLLGALVSGVLFPVATQAKTCLMLYQMADNNLEFYLRQDYNELANSPVIAGEDLRVWIYYDALNQGGQALPSTVDASGSPVSGTFTGSRYITYDPGFGSMKVDTELSGEQNSDTAEQVEAFLSRALGDCLDNGYDSLMAVFSSHGGGFAGYGGDENARRKLLQTNANVASAIRSALDGNSAAPDKLEVLGFDACLMQAVGAADDYMGVADYILASEAVEPGHGWAYSYLSSAPTALELAEQILTTFITQPQGGAHQAPKTLAILNTEKFATFISAFETFWADMLELTPNDTSLHSFTSRSRAASVAYEGIVDAVGSTNPSGLDIGNWLANFKNMCNPGEPLQDDLDLAISSYNDMFHLRGTGPGTSAGTGMHVTWPNQNEYTANTALWNQVLFQNRNYVTEITPNYRAFMEYFLASGTPSGDGTTVCGSGAEPPAEPGLDPTALIQADTGTVNTGAGTFDITATIGAAVSQVLIEYGIDLSTPLKPVLEEKGYAPTDDEYLFLLGGDVAGEYVGSEFKASWNQEFYFLNISGSDTFEALYVFDQGDGSKKIPAMYFPEAFRQNVSALQFLDYLFFDFDYWVSNGASYSFLQFSVNETENRINDNLILFTSNEAGVFTEQPRSAGGYLIPLVYIDAFIQGRQLNTLPGGFNQTVVAWSETIDYNVLTTPAENIFNVIPDTDAVVINMYAYDHGDAEREPDVRYYDVRRERGTKLNVDTGASDGDAESGTPELGSTTEASAAVTARLSGLLAGVALLAYGLL